MLLNNIWVKKRSQVKVKKWFELNDNENTTDQTTEIKLKPFLEKNL